MQSVVVCLAEFTPLSPQAQLALVSLLAVGVMVTVIWSGWRRKPPLDSELVKLNTSVEGLQEMVRTLKEAVKDLAAHAVKLEDLQQKVRTLEQYREEDQKSNRTYTRESSERIFKKLDELKDSVNANFQSIENRLGRVDGALELLSSRVTRAPFDR